MFEVKFYNVISSNKSVNILPSDELLTKNFFDRFSKFSDIISVGSALFFSIRTP